MTSISWSSTNTQSPFEKKMVVEYSQLASIYSDKSKLLSQREESIETTLENGVFDTSRQIGTTQTPAKEIVEYFE
ncbi:MAG TPA: hypothetical protein VIZ21_00190 [Ignavibacteriaceae bacterium]